MMREGQGRDEGGTKEGRGMDDEGGTRDGGWEKDKLVDSCNAVLGRRSWNHNLQIYHILWSLKDKLIKMLMYNLPALVLLQ